MSAQGAPAEGSLWTLGEDAPQSQWPAVGLSWEAWVLKKLPTVEPLLSGRVSGRCWGRSLMGSHVRPSVLTVLPCEGQGSLVRGGFPWKAVQREPVVLWGPLGGVTEAAVSPVLVAVLRRRLGHTRRAAARPAHEAVAPRPANGPCCMEQVRDVGWGQGALPTAGSS